MILAVEDCDFVNELVCAPENVGELFIFPSIFGQVNRTVVLMFLAAFIVVAILYFGLRRKSVRPSKFQAAVESVMGLVRNDISIGIIGPEGVKYFPYLLSIFLLVLVGNLFEVTPLINFPITSRMALPAFLAIVTYLIYLGVGFAKHGISYITDVAWPAYVPVGVRPLVGAIELAQYLVIRPFSLAVRLFANLVAGHVMLSLLLVTGWVFTSNLIVNYGEIGLKGLAGPAWFAFGLGIYGFEIFVSVVQAYIFTLLSAVYIQSSVHPEH